MTDICSIVIDTIVNTLLEVGERVMEISKGQLITRIWDREETSLRVSPQRYLGKKLSELGNDSIFSKCSVYVDECFKTRKSEIFRYNTIDRGFPLTYNLRIITSHPDSDFLFLVIEKAPDAGNFDSVQDKWKLAFEATGDGAWDLNLETKAIFFSDRWHEMFGYGADEIRTRTDWAKKIHPDDVATIERKSEEYLAGITASYSAEMRYLCKDGSYKWVLTRGLIIGRAADGKPLRFIGTHTDINELKRTEDKYFATAKFLSKLIDNLRSGILVTDENQKIVFANQVFSDIFKHEGGPGSLIGTDVTLGLEIRKQIFKEEEEFVSKTKLNFKKTEPVFNEEWELKTGKIISRDYIPISLDHNQIGGIWKLTDITERKNTERRFVEQRNFYEQILNSIKADIVVFDGIGKYLFLNPSAIKDDNLRNWMIGKTDEDYCNLRNKPLSQFERRREIIRRARTERQPIEWEEKLVNREGETEYHLRNLYPVFNESGDMTMAIGYGLNITDRVLAREELKTSMDTFASAFNYSAIGMAIISPEGKWLDVNNVLCDLIGYSKEELLKLTHFDVTHPEDYNIGKPFLARMLKKELTTYTIEKRYLSKKKKIVLVSLTVSLVWNNNGTPKFFIAQAVDITKKKELEIDLLQKHKDLEATKVSLINKITQLEELSHIIAHNLRGPANNIKMLSEALVEKISGIVPCSSIGEAFTEEQLLELIQESANSLLDSLSTLIEITEIKLNKEIPYSECNIGEMIADISCQLQGIVYEKSAEIKLNLEVRQIHYPKVYLENILYNLISNALKYSHKTIVPEIIISTRLKDDKVQIIVKDNGLGIDLKKYGDRVFKLNQIFHEGFDSKGIGLYITKTQVESLGGKIEVSSKLNEGCEFIVTL